MNFSWIDILFIIVFGICAFSGLIRGFAKSVISLFLVIGAVVASKVFSPRLTDILKEKSDLFDRIKTYVAQKYQSIFSGIAGEATSEAVTDSAELHNIPRALWNLITKYLNRPDSGMGGRAEAFGEYAAGIIMNAISFLAIFLAVIIAGWLVSFIIGRLTEVPAIKFIDRLGGLAIGALEGAMFLFVIATVIYSLNVFLHMDSLSTAINNSILIKYFYISMLFD